jgi:hypothetical protein
MSFDGIKWTPTARIQKYSPEVVEELTRLLGYEPKAADFVRLGADPFAVLEIEGNLLTTAGLGHLTTVLTDSSATEVISTARSFLGVGDSSTGATVSDTALVASTNKYYKSLDSVTRTTTTVTNDSVQAVASYDSSTANYAWNEWVLGSSTSGTITSGTSLPGTGGFIYNRKVASMGTKASGAAWTFTVTIKFS